MELLNNRYKILSGIGKGAESEVFLCRDLKLNSNWAMKRIPKKKFDLKECYREVNILKDLRHPGLPIIIDVFEDREYVYIVRDYIEGLTLKDFIQTNGPLNFEEIQSFIGQMTNIIDYLHNREQPIIYRDIKPENIICNSRGRYFLIDFGITRVYKHNHDSDTVYMGTKGYAAPELYGRAQSDQRTDIYAFGVTLYYAFTGKMFNDIEPDLRWVALQADGTGLMKRIVERATQYDPNNRYQNILDLYAESKVLSNDKSQRISKHVTGKSSIGLMGYKKGVGTTYFGLALAKYLAGLGFRVHLIDYAGDMGLEIYEKFLEGERIEEKIKESQFQLGKIKVFKSNHSYIEALRGDCDYQIIDFGSDHFKINEFYKLQYKFFLLPSNPWSYDLKKTEILETMNKSEDVKFLFTLDEGEKYKKICRWLQLNEKKSNAIPYMKDIEDQNELSCLLESILNIGHGTKLEKKRFKFDFFRRKT